MALGPHLHRSLAIMVVFIIGLEAVCYGADFQTEVWPILQKRCIACHGGEQDVEGGLDLTNARDAFLRGDSGKHAIVRGDLNSSQLWRRIISADESQQMPPEGERLTEAEVLFIRQWIEGGAEWPQQAQQSHWSYVAPDIQRPPIDTSGWSQNPIDQFVIARMAEKGLAPSKQAHPARLLRRLYLDLIGLPPSIGSVNRFLADPSEQAYQREVNRLLASPQYGEKWARHWLDLARYSDSNGYQADQIREMWAFRDWVINAINLDMPYDQFTVEQLAGDILPNATVSQQIATGFHRATTCNVEAGVDPEGNRTDQIIDRVNTTGTTWLGTTLECAQCHNHKYDPISQQEYYELFAFFNNTPMEVKQEGKDSVQFSFYGPKLELPVAKTWAAKNRTAEFHAVSKQQQEIENRIQAIQKSNAKGKPSQLKTLRQQKAQLASQLSVLAPSTTLVMSEMAQKRQTALFVRGDFLTPGDIVKASTPRALNPFPNQQPRNRLGLAHWIVDPKNPLTARVAVNRWWHEFFGRGLVETLDDFGTQGSPPSHPQLLDWLAIRLRDDAAWSMKSIHRLIVTSTTYRQSAKTDSDRRRNDPGNQWLARGPRNRLPAELIRDNALAISGQLMTTMHGPPIYPPQPAGLWHQTGRNEPIFKTEKDADRFRRGVYVIWRRAAPYPSFTAFDAPDRMTCTARRSQTNTPLQALALLNDDVYVELAKAMALRVLTEASDRELSSQLEYAMKLAISRPPSNDELTLLSNLFEEELSDLRRRPERVKALTDERDLELLPASESVDRQSLAVWFSVCNTILNLDEVITK